MFIVMTHKAWCIVPLLSFLCMGEFTTLFTYGRDLSEMNKILLWPPEKNRVHYGSAQGPLEGSSVKLDLE